MGSNREGRRKVPAARLPGSPPVFLRRAAYFRRTISLVRLSPEAWRR